MTEDDKQIFHRAKMSEECQARWNRDDSPWREQQIVTIEKVFWGKGIHSGIIRAKILFEGGVRYVSYTELQPF